MAVNTVITFFYMFGVDVNIVHTVVSYVGGGVFNIVHTVDSYVWGVC